MPSLAELRRSGFRTIPITTSWADAIYSVGLYLLVYGVIFAWPAGTTAIVVAFAIFGTFAIVITTLRARRWDDTTFREPVIPTKVMALIPLGVAVAFMASDIWLSHEVAPFLIAPVVLALTTAAVWFVERRRVPPVGAGRPTA